MAITPTDIIKLLSGFKKDNSYSNSIKEHRDDKILSNPIEAEKGEVLLTYDSNKSDYPRVYVIKGKKHKDGGTFLDVRDKSFIFSDDPSMKIKDKEVLALFGEDKPKTPAQIASKYLFNDSVKDIEDNTKDTYRKNGAMVDIDNKMGMLSLLGIYQENMKGGKVPEFSINYLSNKGIDIGEYLQKLGLDVSKMMGQEEGAKRAAYGLEVYGMQDPNNPNNNQQQPSDRVNTPQGDNNLTGSEANKDQAKDLQKAGQQDITTNPNQNNNTIKIQGGFGYLNTLNLMANIADKMLQNRVNYSYQQNNPVNTDTTNPVIAATDRGDFVKAGTQEGTYRPNYYGNYTNFQQYIPEIQKAGYNVYQPNVMMKKGGSVDFMSILRKYQKYDDMSNYKKYEEGGNVNPDADEALKVVFDKLKEKGVIKTNESFEDFKNKNSKELDKFYIYYDKIKEKVKNQDFKDLSPEVNQSDFKNRTGIDYNEFNKRLNELKEKITKEEISKDDLAKVLTHKLAANFINSKYNIEENTKWDTTKEGISEGYNKKRKDFNDAIFESAGIKETDLHKILNPDIKNAKVDAIGLNALFQKTAGLKVDGIAGQNTAFKYDVAKIEDNNNKVQQTGQQQPNQQNQQQTPSATQPANNNQKKQAEGDKDTEPKTVYTEEPNKSVPPINTMDTEQAKEDKKKLEDAIKDLTNRKAIDNTFFKQDVNNIMGAFANLSSIKKYMPVAFTWDPVVGRPVYYSPERQLQAQQQAANISAKALGTALPSGVAGAAISGISGNLGEQTANTIAQTAATNIGITNQYNNTQAEAANQMAQNRAALLTNIYDKAVLANQNFDNARKQGWAGLIAAYNTALTNRALRQTSNLAYLKGTPFMINEEGGISLVPGWENTFRGQYKNKVQWFFNYMAALDRAGISKEERAKIASEFLKQNPEYAEALGSTDWTGTATATQSGSSQAPDLKSTQPSSQQNNNNNNTQPNNNQQQSDTNKNINTEELFKKGAEYINNQFPIFYIQQSNAEPISANNKLNKSQNIELNRRQYGGGIDNASNTINQLSPLSKLLTLMGKNKLYKQ